MAAEWLAQYGVLVDRDADVPVGVQLAWGLRSAVASGALQPGERLPPLRELAEGLGLNTNTVRAVIAELERQGFLDARQGSGTFVASAPPVQRTLPALVDEMVLAAHAAGVEPRLL